MQEDLLFEPISKLQKDLSSSPFLRFYLQEDVFRTLSQQLIELPFNQVALEVITETHLSSKFLTLNTRLNTNFLTNGKDILHRKKGYLQSFLKEYRLIEQGIVYLAPVQKQMFLYSVIALANLILKLSINTAKINIVTITRMLTPSFMNIAIVSVLFEKYLALQVLRSKEGRSPEEWKNFIRQLPKLTIIKLSKARNPYDFYMLSKAQSLLGQTAHNIQLIELFEEEEQLQENLSSIELKRREKFNLQNLFGIKSPYGMQLYLFFLQVLIEKMTEFKPDLIMFIDALPLDSVSIEPNIKGLILNELSAKVQNKICVLQEIGVTDDLKGQYLTQQNRIALPEISQSFKRGLLQSLTPAVPNIYLAAINSYQNANLKEVRARSISSFIQQNCEVENDITNQFIKLREDIFDKKMRFQPFPQQWPSIRKMRKAYYDDISNLSLSLTQQRNFEGILREFRNYPFPVAFLERLVSWLEGEKAKIEKSEISFSDYGERLKTKIDRIKGMKEMSMLKFNASLCQERSFGFYSILLNKMEYPSEIVNGKERSLAISQQDALYIHYTDQYTLLLHFGNESFNIFCKQHADEKYTCLRREMFSSKRELSAQHSTLIANKQYFYKAFGRFQDGQTSKSYICRLRIDNLNAIKETEWEITDRYISHGKNGKQDLALETKRLGWGESVEAAGTNWIIFGGGYNDSAINEERVNKSLYLIKNNKFEVLKVGKTSSTLLNDIENSRQKLAVHPFVFGVPLSISQQQLVVLNTNGSIEHLAHYRKLYITKYKLPLGPNHPITVTSQNKMNYGKDPELAIANKSSLLACIQGGYTQVNRFKGKACFYNADGQPVFLVFKGGLFGMMDKVQAVPLTEEMRKEGDEVFVSFQTIRMVLRQARSK